MTTVWESCRHWGGGATCSESTLPGTKSESGQAELSHIMQWRHCLSLAWNHCIKLLKITCCSINNKGFCKVHQVQFDSFQTFLSTLLLFKTSRDPENSFNGVKTHRWKWIFLQVWLGLSVAWHLCRRSGSFQPAPLYCGSLCCRRGWRCQPDCPRWRRRFPGRWWRWDPLQWWQLQGWDCC